MSNNRGDTVAFFQSHLRQPPTEPSHELELHGGPYDGERFHWPARYEFDGRLAIPVNDPETVHALYVTTEFPNKACFIGYWGPEEMAAFYSGERHLLAGGASGGVVS